MSSNPFEDDDLFGAPAPKQQPHANGGGGRGSAPAPGAAHNPAALMAAQMGVQHGGGAGSDKAARLFAASQANAAAAAAAAAAAPQRREGASASAFESRERNARHSLIQTQVQHGAGGGPAVAFPMTDLVDAQNDKKLGLSFASLAVRDGRSRAGSNEGLQVEGGVAASQAQKPLQAATVDPWAQSAFSPTSSSGNDPFGRQPTVAPVFRQPHPQQQRQQQQQPQARAPAPAAANLNDFDPLSFGDMSASAAPKAAPKAAASADPWGALAGQQSAPVAPAPAAAPASKPKKKKAPVVESSSDDSSEEESEEEDSDDEDDGAAAAAAAARQKEKARQAQLAQRERERAEAVAYDEKRKADIAAARRASSSGASSSSAPQQHQPRMQSRALDASDESAARDIAANETDAEKLKRSGTKQSYPQAVIARWGSNPAEHWAYSKTKTRSKLMMPKVCVYWRFIWAGVRHEVELFHSTVSGKRTIRCDGALVAQEKLFIDTGSRHDFTIGTGTRPCQITVLICASGSEFAYELFVNKVRFYQALQAWLIDLQKDPSAASKLEPLSPHAINTVGEIPKQRRQAY